MIYQYESIQAFLADELQRRVKGNPHYSLRSFAQNLRLSPGALSEILRGRREVSLRSIPQIAKSIGLSAAEGRHLLKLAQAAKAAKNQDLQPFKQTGQSRDQLILSEDLFNLVSEWYHFAILSLLDCDAFQWHSAWIGKRLGISRIQAQMAMSLLLRMGLVVKENGRYQGTNRQVASPSEIPSAGVRRYHRQILDKVAEAIEGQSLSDRDISGCSAAIDIAHLPAIKREIREFQDHLLSRYSNGKKTEVYFLQINLFRLTQRSDK